MNSNGIGWAIKNMRNGSKVSRLGWNGKGIYIVIQKGYPDGIPIDRNTAEATGLPEGTICKFHPYTTSERNMMMKTVDGSFVPWLASQADILAMDWGIANTIASV